MAVRKLSLERTSAQETLRRWHDERSLRHALRIARIGYWESHSPAATQIWVSPEFATLYECETIDGLLSIETVQARSEPESRKKLKSHYLKCWKMGVAYAVNTQLRKSDGSLLRCIVHGEPDFDAEGRIQRVFGIVRDVTLEASALQRSAEIEQRLADFVSTASDWCWETGPDHRLLPYPKFLAGNAALQMVASGGKARWELSFAPDEQASMAVHRADMEAHRPFRDFVYSLIGEDGSRISIRTSGKPIFSDDGRFQGYRGTASDITQLSIARSLLDKRTRALEEAHRLGKIGTWRHKLKTGKTTWSPELYHLLGFDPQTFEPTAKNIRPYFLGDDADRFWAMQTRILRTCETEGIDLRIQHTDGKTRDLAVICKVEVVDGKAVGIIGTAQDVTDRKEAERRLEQLAYTDPLTGLANRALFKRRLAALVEDSASDGSVGALLLIDLDRFKEVNDTLGHFAGDRLLIHVADVLRRETDPEAFVARLGGDEFAVLLHGHRSMHGDILHLATRLIRRLSAPVDITEGEACIGATIGIAMLPEHGRTADVAARNADLALYMAKEAGRGQARLFQPAYAQAVDKKLDLGRSLRRAVEAGTLETHYQPQIDLKTGRVIGFEALVRWSHPDHGPISPSEFIPIAENSGLIVDLGRAVLRSACRQGRDWLDAGLPRRSVSVNVSPAQIWNGDFETVVAAALAETAFPPNLLCLELTESLFVDHTKNRVRNTLTGLSKIGVQLALDDFGSGYSSLGYLTRLPFNCLKIDRSFVDGISVAPEKCKLLGGMIALSHGLGMSVVAEGAELQEEVDVLTGFDCDVVQGFVFSPPISAEKAPSVAAEIERVCRGPSARYLVRDDHDMRAR